MNYKPPTVEQLQLFMSRNGLTAAEVAKTCGISKYTVLQWMNNKKTPYYSQWKLLNMTYEGRTI
jgi:transcriptional regulator with XRE-family HTH domain